MKKWIWLLILLILIVLLGFGYVLWSRSSTLTLSKHDPDSVVLQRLFSQLKKDQFNIEAQSLGTLGFLACSKEETRTYKGSGVRQYYMRRPVSIGISSGPVYPDFLLQVLEFEYASEAEEHAKWIIGRGMIWDNECISGLTSKGPEKIVVNGTVVYILSARAEMLRDFTEKYGKQLEGN